MDADYRDILPLILTLSAIGAQLTTGALALLFGRKKKAALAIGLGAGSAASALSLAAGTMGLLWQSKTELIGPWSAPVGSLHLGIDPLSSFFLICISAVAILAAVYGIAYLPRAAGKRPIGGPLCFFNVLAGCMALVVVARDGVLFLMAWEAMFLASYFLVVFENEKEETRRAGKIYLFVSHAGAILLFFAIAMLSGNSGGFDFSAFGENGLDGPWEIACIGCVIVGFGVKAGFWPLHLWLPEAHPAAPTHVSALMSGAMIKMGVYGLFRFLPFFGRPEIWLGELLTAIGAAAGIMGALYALAQTDLKRLLAYSSVENIGVIALGMGLGTIGQAKGDVLAATLGFGGALMHTLNHGLFKGLLFQAAGAVIHASGTRSIDEMGGLLKRMPFTGGAFFAGSLAVCGLPPFNGFVGEWLIFLSGLQIVKSAADGEAIAAASALAALGLIGGLAGAAFLRAFSIAFLGVARSERTAQAHEPPAPMKFAMAAGAFACLSIGLWPHPVLFLAQRALGAEATSFAGAWGAAAPFTTPWILLLGFAAFLHCARTAILRRKTVASGPTWGCGYEAPTARMQYTGASFSRPILASFSGPPPHASGSGEIEGYFPPEAGVEKAFAPSGREKAFYSATRRLALQIGKVRMLQQGRIQIYLLYILIALLSLLVWQFWGGMK